MDAVGLVPGPSGKGINWITGFAIIWQKLNWIPVRGKRTSKEI